VGSRSFEIKDYYQLTKPGIIYGNIITAAGGFLLASRFHIHAVLFLATLIGTSLIIGSACVFNNYIDRNIDKAMARTKKRALALGSISGRNALIYATVLGVLGVVSLALYVNWLTVLIGLIAFFVYVVLYGISKRRSVHGTVVGSIAGAAPVVAGYCAVSDHFNGAALILFLILVTWQMPHFYAIAMYRIKDYAAAKIPVLPIKSGMRATKIQMLVYIVAFILANISLSLFGTTKVIYLIVMTILGLAWLWLGIQGFKSDDTKWARKMFFFSLIIILTLSVMLSVGAILP
jgi:protoheme IX farnesyltransferase